MVSPRSAAIAAASSQMGPMRVVRTGVFPVAGLPRGRFPVVSVSLMAEVYYRKSPDSLRPPCFVYYTYS